jgi:small subunit ribosomal protein S20
MPIIQSAKKRVKVATKATIRNRKTKRSIKSAVKELQANLAGDKKKANELLAKAQGEIDKAVKKGVLHKNKAARKKAQLAKASKEAGVKPAKTTIKKAPVKASSKSATKKPVAKKVSDKKTTSKK